MADTSITTASQKQDPKDNASPMPGVGTVGPAATSGAANAAEAADLRAKLKDAGDDKVVAKAQDEAAQARVKATEAQAKAEDAGKSKEQIAADKAMADADDAMAKAMETQRANPSALPAATVGEARVAAPVDPEMGLGDHHAQKFGNDPANPKIFKGEQADPEKCTVRLVMDSPDPPHVRETWVHPEMVGDYLRAGWAKAAA